MSIRRLHLANQILSAIELKTLHAVSVKPKKNCFSLFHNISIDIKTFTIYRFRLPKETETGKSTSGSAGILMEVSAAAVNNDNIMESIEQQPLVGTNDSPKLDQFLLESLAAVVTNESASVSSSNGFEGNSSTPQSSQNTNDPPEMPQLMSILNELLDGQDITSLANTGGNGDSIQIMVDHEENYEDESPRKDDPEELARLLVLQRLEMISREEQQLQRKMDFLIRRLYKLVARSTGTHASEEIAGFLEHVARHHKQKEKQITFFNGSSSADCIREAHQVSSELPATLLSSPSTSQPNQIESTAVEEPINPVPSSDMKTFLKRMESLATMQSTIVNKRAHAIKYFTKPLPSTHEILTKSENNCFRNVVPRFEERDLTQLEQVSGLLMSELRLIGKQVDADETASSSGGESADEMISYNNHYQQSLSM